MRAHNDGKGRHLVRTVGARTCSLGKLCARGLRLPLNANVTCCVHDSRRYVTHPNVLAELTFAMQMERENMELYSEIQEHEAAQERTEARTAEIFAFFDEVGPCAMQCTQSDSCLVVRSTQSGRNYHWRTCSRGRC